MNFCYTVLGITTLSIGACNADVPTTKDPVIVRTSVARAIIGEDIKIIFTSEDFASRLDEISNGLSPRDFHWSSLTFPKEASEQLFSEEGVNVDFALQVPAIKFEQVYRETCNPAKEDFSPCWISEVYTSGDVGLAGRGTLSVVPGRATGNYRIEWQGKTDRFGDPIQLYSHVTEARIAARLDEEPAGSY